MNMEVYGDEAGGNFYVRQAIELGLLKKDSVIADCVMVGNKGFDPWGLSTPQNIKWMREAELKHGRMCQLAWLGYVAVDLGIKFPGEKYAALTSFAAHDATAKYELFMALLFVGTFETIGFSQIYSMTEGSDREPGDFGFDPLGFAKKDKARLELAEIKNGRLAMLGFSGMIHGNFITGKGPIAALTSLDWHQKF